MNTSKAPYIANFDSAAAMLRAVANYLHGEDFPMLGTIPKSRAPLMKVVGSAINALPVALREQVYIWSGRAEAVPARKLLGADMNRVAEWATGLYPQRSYPAVAIGSSNGAAVHLWAALGIPWLPQTFLTPVARSGVHPDEPQQEVRWAEKPARDFLAANPDVALHHMFDPNQDRLMLQRMTYFRFKWLRLPAAYRQFIERWLMPGGTIFLVECGLSWPATRLGERYLFQFGALGGATPEEYLNGGERVADFLARNNSRRRKWEPPQSDGEHPEAEWGFEPQLRDDLEEWAVRRGFAIRRVVFQQPEDLSPWVAEFYRWWNRCRGIEAARLLVESFVVMEPFWVVRTGSVPFWMVFNVEPSARALADYLAGTKEFDEIFLMLFSHGVDSIGLAGIKRWRALLARAKRSGEWVGVDSAVYPRDFAVFVRYHDDLLRKVKARHPLPEPVALKDFDAFVQESAGDSRVQWL